MSAENKDSLMERIPLEIDDEPLEEAPPIKIEGDDLMGESPMGAQAQESKKIRSFDTSDKIGAKKADHKYKRSLTMTGTGASRVRTFHTKLSDTAMSYLDGLINDWLDENPDIEVKFSNTTVGVVEGKRAEPHLIITVWY
ncbi:MAG: hypothetical protein JW810_03605 [Sedimentisphaerales bacterium]|nr:hypothetical protein [Sedimentisphaerales bacterium]